MFKLISKKYLTILLMLITLSACSFFDKDNTPTPTPLKPFTAEVKPQLLWSVKTGGGSGDEYLKMSPAVGALAIFTTSSKGTVTSINKVNGRINWQVETHVPLTTGPGIGQGMIVVGSRYGDVLALQQQDGRIRWKMALPGEILAKPAIAEGQVIIKTIDGYARALSLQNGQERWSFQQVEPTLILRGASAPVIRDRDVIIGFSNGNLAKLIVSDGRLVWQQAIATPEGAFAIQRMIDIDATPITYEHHIYAATYQGKIASLDWTSGRILWNHDISSYSGMSADANTVYIADAKGYVWAFDADSGLVKWRQMHLASRVVSGPATMGNYIVVGDAEGYLHWLGISDGHFAGRVSAGSTIYAAPIVENNVVYVLTDTGQLLAYTLR